MHSPGRLRETCIAAPDILHPEMSSKDAAEVKHEKESQGAVAEGEVEAKSEQKEANKVSEGKGSEGGGDDDENVVPGKTSPTNATNAEGI